MSWETLTGGGAAVLAPAARLVVALRLIPWLGGRPLPWPAILVVAPALAAMVASGMPVPRSGPLATGGGLSLVALLPREVVIGACLGLTVRLAMGVFEIAGGMADAAARAFPGDGRGPHGLLYDAVGVAAFLAMGGHRVLLGLLWGSFAAVPPGGGAAPPGLAETGAVALLGGAFAAALAVAGPLFVASLVADLSVSLLARAEPALGAGAGPQAARSLAVNIAMIALLGAGAALAADVASEGLARAAAFLAENSS